MDAEAPAITSALLVCVHSNVSGKEMRCKKASFQRSQFLLKDFQKTYLKIAYITYISLFNTSYKGLGRYNHIYQVE